MRQNTTIHGDIFSFANEKNMLYLCRNKKSGESMLKKETSLLIEELSETGSLSLSEYARLIEERSEESAELLKTLAAKKRKEIYGNRVFIRGLIEISNICKNDCFYCGIRKENKRCTRYRLTKDEILACCEKGYTLGFRTFVLQGGEDDAFSDDFLCELIGKIKEKHSDCAVTLSLGEKKRESYERLYNAGADRYLLRHETADPEHYMKLHPKKMSFENRMRCLAELKEIGYRVGCGFMVGSPFQTSESLAMDLKFIEELKPDMCGIGPFIPHKETPFAEFSEGSVSLTCYLLSIIRLIQPNVLLPATTALATLRKNGTALGIMSGANVVMPNLSPVNVRGKYEIYENKARSGTESAEQVELLKKEMSKIGYEIAVDRGDIIK